MDDNSYKINKNWVKRFVIMAVVGVIWIGFNLLIVTQSGHMIPVYLIYIIYVAIYTCIKVYLDKKYPLTELTDSEKQVDVTISLEEYKKLREMRNAEYDRKADNTDKTAVNFRKHGE